MTRDLALIDAVAARVPADRVNSLQRSPGVMRVWPDATVRSLAMSSPPPPGDLLRARRRREVPEASEALNAMPVWTAGNLGSGVGVAVLDSGVKTYRELVEGSEGNRDGLTRGYSAWIDRSIEDDDEDDDDRANNDGRHDRNGHGTIVASVISNVQQGRGRKYLGVAPDSIIIPVQVLDADGQGSYSQVIDGIQWVVEHKERYNIRVMNVSLSAPVRSWYWDDPLNQAIIRTWKAGIVVVVAAGNGGPDPMSIGVPGNVPYVITVGALTDAQTPGNWADDYIPNFSAAGPTYEAFVKPDLVAPGGHLVGLMPPRSELARQHPESRMTKNYYQMSGTSMSAAQVSGVVALMLAENPELRPDEIKYRLMASALPALDPGDPSGNAPGYNVWQQGAGRVDAWGAVYGDHRGRANRGLNVTADLGLAGPPRHFVGYTRWDADRGRFYLQGTEQHGWEDPYGGSNMGFVWSETSAQEAGFVWSESYAWGGGFVWSESFPWGDAAPEGAGVVWSEGFVWSEDFQWSDAVAELVTWVSNE